VQNTDYEFILPRGFVDEAGNVHQVGIMRLATSLDEITPLTDARVQANEGYLGILLLARVIIRLGGFSPVPVALLERLYAADYVFLQDLYIQINSGVGSLQVLNQGLIETECPNCQARFLLDLSMQNS
jgi:hypothetical protein